MSVTFASFLSALLLMLCLIYRTQLKAHALMSLEQQPQLLEELGVAVLNGTPSLGFDNTESVIDSISLNDVNEAVSRVLKGKVAISAVGSVHNVPYQEDLL